MAKKIGILTAGSDCPGLNAAIRGFGKAALNHYDISLIGFNDGFQGLLENDSFDVGSGNLSNVLTAGGTILGTSRVVPQKVRDGTKIVDKTDLAVENYHKNNLDGLVCIGSVETQEVAFILKKAGLNVLTLPKSANNDVPLTDVTIGYDTALLIATEAIDRLHSTANSNHRIIIVEIMGREAGWLTLGAGIAAGADVILIPEIPYSIERVSEAILNRNKAGKMFSIVAVSEGANSAELMAFFERSMKLNKKLHDGQSMRSGEERISELKKKYTGQTMLLANRLEELTGLETRITILGYLLRGGAPSARDRVLATYLGTRAAEWIAEDQFGGMLAVRGDSLEIVPFEEVVKETKLVPMDHPWITGARLVGTVLGD